MLLKHFTQKNVIVQSKPHKRSLLTVEFITVEGTHSKDAHTWDIQRATANSFAASWCAAAHSANVSTPSFSAQPLDLFSVELSEMYLIDVMKSQWYFLHWFIHTFFKMHSQHMHLPCLQIFFPATIAADTIINQTYQGSHTKHSSGTCAFVCTCLWICIVECVSDLRLHFKARRAAWTSPTPRIGFPPAHQRHCLFNTLRLLVAWGGSARTRPKVMHDFYCSIRFHSHTFFLHSAGVSPCDTLAIHNTSSVLGEQEQISEHPRTWAEWTCAHQWTTLIFFIPTETEQRDRTGRLRLPVQISPPLIQRGFNFPSRKRRPRMDLNRIVYRLLTCKHLALHQRQVLNGWIDRLLTICQFISLTPLCCRLLMLNLCHRQRRKKRL